MTFPLSQSYLEDRGDEFENDKPVSEKNKRVENSEQPLSGQQLSEFEDEKQLDKKKACTVEVWKDEVIEIVTKEMKE